MRGRIGVGNNLGPREGPLMGLPHCQEPIAHQRPVSQLQDFAAAAAAAAADFDKTGPAVITTFFCFCFFVVVYIARCCALAPTSLAPLPIRPRNSAGKMVHQLKELRPDPYPTLGV